MAFRRIHSGNPGVSIIGTSVGVIGGAVNPGGAFASGVTALATNLGGQIAYDVSRGQVPTIDPVAAGISTVAGFSIGYVKPGLAQSFQKSLFRGQRHVMTRGFVDAAFGLPSNVLLRFSLQGVVEGLRLAFGPLPQRPRQCLLLAMVQIILERNDPRCSFALVEMSKPTSSTKTLSSPTEGRVFKFKQGLEDVKWGSIPFTFFCFVFILVITFYQHPDYTISKKLPHISLFVLCILASNYAFYMWWRTPRTLIVTKETLIGKRVLGKDLVLPWSSITTIKRVLFHWKWSGLKIVSRLMHCSFIIGDEIEDFEELLRLIQYHVRRHNPSAQFIGLPDVPVDWRPTPTTSQLNPGLPAWLRFEIPTRRRSFRGPLVTGLGIVGLVISLRAFLVPAPDPAYAVRLSLLAMIVLVLGVLLWLIDWTKTGQSERG